MNPAKAGGGRLQSPPRRRLAPDARVGRAGASAPTRSGSVGGCWRQTNGLRDSSKEEGHVRPSSQTERRTPSPNRGCLGSKALDPMPWRLAFGTDAISPRRDLRAASTRREKSCFRARRCTCRRPLTWRCDFRDRARERTVGGSARQAAKSGVDEALRLPSVIAGIMLGRCYGRAALPWRHGDHFEGTRAMAPRTEGLQRPKRMVNAP